MSALFRLHSFVLERTNLSIIFWDFAERCAQLQIRTFYNSMRRRNWIKRNRYLYHLLRHKPHVEYTFGLLQPARLSLWNERLLLLSKQIIQQRANLQMQAAKSIAQCHSNLEAPEILTF